MLKLYIYLLTPFIFALMATFAVAQTLTEVMELPAASVGAYAWKMLMLVITLGGSSLTPYATKYLTMGVLKVIGMAQANVPGPVLVCISTIISGVFAGVMGSETELPLHGDSAALMGATLGGAAQKFAHNDPAEIKPVATETTAPPAAGLSAFWLPLLLLAGGLVSLTACVSDMDLGNGRVMNLAKVETRSAFGVNDSRSRLRDCELAKDGQYIDCHWMESDWRQSASPGQGGQVVGAALQGIGLGIAGTMIGGSSTSANAASSASSASTSIVTMPGKGHH